MSKNFFGASKSRIGACFAYKIPLVSIGEIDPIARDSAENELEKYICRLVGANRSLIVAWKVFDDSELVEKDFFELFQYYFGWYVRGKDCFDHVQVLMDTAIVQVFPDLRMRFELFIDKLKDELANEVSQDVIERMNLFANKIRLHIEHDLPLVGVDGKCAYSVGYELL